MGEEIDTEVQGVMDSGVTRGVQEALGWGSSKEYKGAIGVGDDQRNTETLDR